MISSDGGRAYVMNGVANTVSVVDLDTLTTAGAPMALKGGDASHMPFGRYLGMWLSPKGQKLFVFNAQDDTIERFDTATRKRLGAKKVRYRFYTLAANADRSAVAIADKNGVSIVDGSDMRLEQRLSYCGYRNYSSPQMALSSGGRYLTFHSRRARYTWIT